MHIPDQTLNQLLSGGPVITCYQCDICVDESNPSVNMSACGTTPCPGFSCSFVAARYSPRSVEQCGNNWRFNSFCIRSPESAQVDITLMYYINSNTLDLYEMEGICRGDKCNNFNTFLQLKSNITIDPDFSCLFSTTTDSSTTTSTSTTSPSFADSIHVNDKLLILMIFLFIYQIKNH